MIHYQTMVNIFTSFKYSNLIFTSIVSSVVKDQFFKLGAIHAHNSNLHTDPPRLSTQKRSRKAKGKGDPREPIEDPDSDGPFTLTRKEATEGKDVKKHQITILHDRPLPPPHTPLAVIPTSVPSSQEIAIRQIDLKINIIDGILSTLNKEDPEFAEYQKKKRILLITKLDVIDNPEDTSKDK